MLGGSVAFRGERDVFLSGKLAEGGEEEEETEESRVHVFRKRRRRAVTPLWNLWKRVWAKEVLWVGLWLN